MAAASISPMGDAYNSRSQFTPPTGPPITSMNTGIPMDMGRPIDAILASLTTDTQYGIQTRDMGLRSLMARAGSRLVLPGEPGGTRQVNHPVVATFNIKRPSEVAVEGWKPRIPRQRDMLIGWRQPFGRMGDGESSMPQLSFMLPGEMFGLPVGATGVMAPTPIVATDPIALNYQLASEEWAHHQARLLDGDEENMAKIALSERSPRQTWFRNYWLIGPAASEPTIPASQGLNQSWLTADERMITADLYGMTDYEVKDYTEGRGSAMGARLFFVFKPMRITSRTKYIFPGSAAEATGPDRDPVEATIPLDPHDHFFANQLCALALPNDGYPAAGYFEYETYGGHRGHDGLLLPYGRVQAPQRQMLSAAGALDDVYRTITPEELVPITDGITIGSLQPLRVHISKGMGRD